MGLDANDKGARVKSGMVRKKSKAMHQQERDLRANLLKLAEACPFHLANPEECPLFPLRKMEPEKRLQWLNALGDSD